VSTLGSGRCLLGAAPSRLAAEEGEMTQMLSIVCAMAAMGAAGDGNMYLKPDGALAGELVWFCRIHRAHLEDQAER
jgi:hypothetical protein